MLSDSGSVSPDGLDIVSSINFLPKVAKPGTGGSGEEEPLRLLSGG